jgi:hypothetical protein
MTDYQMNREDLEKRALEVVCPCWTYDLRDMIDATEDEDLRKVIAYPAWFHIQNQIFNPLSAAEFIEEMATCPDTHIKGDV